MAINRQVFFNEVRSSLFRGKFSQKQVNGLNTLLDVWESGYMEENDPAVLAYCFATAKHETADTMQPIGEYGGDHRAESLYGPHGKNPDRARRMGNTRRGDGARYKGRGYVQLTWKNNYKKAAGEVGVDLVKHPDKALVPRVAADILFAGCIEGWFTGKGLDSYINDSKKDFRNARRVVNGLDKAQLIAGYAHAFDEAISAALEAEDLAPDVVVVPPTTGKDAGKSSTIWTTIGAIGTAVIGAATQFITAVSESLGSWPTVVMFAIIVGAGVYVIRERRRHAEENGV